MEPRISIVTLGVADVPAATRFYSTWLGAELSGSSDDSVAFFRTAGTVLALYGRDALVEDIGPGLAEPATGGFSGVTLAHNARERGEVDEIVGAAVAAGGTLVKAPAEAFWGGYSGYVADPDGHLWEIAWGAFPIGEDGHLVLPAPGEPPYSPATPDEQGDAS